MTKHKRAGAALATLSLILSGSVFAGPAQAVGNSSDWTVLDGTVLDSDGSPLVNAEVKAYAAIAEPESGSFTSVAIASGMTSSNGDIHLDALPLAQPANYVADDGTVHVEFEIAGPLSGVQYELDVPYVTGTTSAGTISAANRAREASQSASRSSNGAGLSVKRSRVVFHAIPYGSRPTAVTNQDKHSTIQEADPGVDDRTESIDTQATTSSYGCTDGYSPTYIRQSTFKDVNVRIQQLNTLSKSRIGYSFENSDATRFGVAFEHSGSAGYVGYQVSLEKSEEQATDMGGSTLAANGTNEFVAVEWRYYKFEKYCSGNFSFNQGLHYTGSWEWKPIKWTTGSALLNTTSTFSCNPDHKVPMAITTWVARTTTRTISGAVTVSSVTLSASQQNSSSQKLTVDPDSGQSAKICGYGETPDKATRIEEVN